MGETMEPCPFCGSTNTDPKEWMAGDGSQGPGCENCGATARNVEEWNAAGRRAARLAEAVDLLRMWVIWDSMADGAKSPHQLTDTFLLLQRATVSASVVCQKCGRRYGSDHAVCPWVECKASGAESSGPALG